LKSAKFSDVLLAKFLAEDGRVSPKRVGVSKQLYCYVYQMCISQFYK